MEQWNEVLQAVGSRLGPFLPRALGVSALLLGAWLLARFARGAVHRIGRARDLDRRLGSPGLMDLLANIAFWLVWLFAMPALLDLLELGALLAPVNAMMARLFAAVPGFMGAAVILGVGFLFARILRELITGILTAAGSERLAARIGLASALGGRSLASALGTVVFLLVLLPSVVAALQALGLDMVARSVGRLFESVIDLIPRLVSAGLILAIGVLLGRVLAGFVTAFLAGLGINRLPQALGLEPGWRAGGRDPSELAGSVVMVGAILLSATQACEALGFAALTEAVTLLGGVLARVAVGLFVLLLGVWLGALAARLVLGSGVNQARVLAHLVRGVILFFAAALALRQAGLPADIVTIAFASVFVAVALAVAIAVGVGGRHVAGRLLEAAVASFQNPQDKRPAPTDAAIDAGPGDRTA
jgi:hypothetical protein